MEYRVFQYGDDETYINDIVRGLGISENRGLKPEKLFCQCFEQNPIGKALLICAYDRNKVVACVVLERVPIDETGLHPSAGCISRYYVQPEYSSKDLLIELFKLAEKVATSNGLDIILTRNEPSLNVCARELEWSCSENKIGITINSITGLWQSLFKLVDIKKPFVPDIQKVKNEDDNISQMSFREGTENSNMIMVYYSWLKQISANKYIMIDDDFVSAVAIIGHRGKRLKVAHVLYLKTKKNIKVTNHHLMELFNTKYKGECIDVISCDDDMHTLLCGNSFRMSRIASYNFKLLRKSKNTETTKMLNNIVYMF